nr:twin-arginine translocation signal domain-containing protein [bacterium]
MCQCDCHEHTGMSRRDFFQAVGVSTAAGALAWRAVAPGVVHAAGRTKAPATVLGAFLYPSTEALRKEGYYSWPGSGFDAEGRQKA